MMNKDNIELLFRTHYGKMLKLANTLLHDEEAARDIVHDVFSSLLIGREKTVNESYLMNGVKFRCLKYIRSMSTQERLRYLYAIEYDDIEDEDWPDEQMIGVLRDAIDKELPETTRRIVRLRFYQRMPYKEISNFLSISEVTVYKHLHHAIEVLRKKIKDNER